MRGHASTALSGWKFDTLIFMPEFPRWVIAAPEKNLVVGVANMVASNDGNCRTGHLFAPAPAWVWRFMTR